MRMFWSFFFRLIHILLVTISLCGILAAATLVIQQNVKLVQYLCLGAFIALLCAWILRLFIKKMDPELSIEVGRILLPLGAFFSLLLSLVLAVYFADFLTDEKAGQQYILPLGGLSVAAFLIVRSFDVKWMRGEAELATRRRARERKAGVQE